MLANTLTTNEVKDAAGTEVEYQRISIAQNQTEFAKIGEPPAYPDRMSIKHSTSGKGVKLRQRSVFRFDITSLSDVDSVTPVVDSGMVILDTAKGAHLTTAQGKAVLARVMSFLASKGASTTILYDCTGYGAESLLNESI